MKLDLPTPGVPVSPTRSAGRAGAPSRVEQRPRRRAVVGPGRFDQRDRPRQRPPVARREPRRQRRRPRLAITQASPAPSPSPLGLRPPLWHTRSRLSRPDPRASPMPMPIRARAALALGLALARRRRRPGRARRVFDFSIAGIRVGALTLEHRAVRRQLHAPRAASTPPGIVGIFADFFFDGTADRQRRAATARVVPAPLRRHLEVAARARATPRSTGRAARRSASRSSRRAAPRPIRPTQARHARPGLGRLRGCSATAPPDGICDTTRRRLRRLAPVAAEARRRRSPTTTASSATAPTPGSRARRTAWPSAARVPVPRSSSAANGDGLAAARAHRGADQLRPGGDRAAGLSRRAVPPLPIEPVLPAARAGAARRRPRRAAGPARRRQDHPRAALPARGRLVPAAS